MKQKAALYIRVSTTHQIDKDSLPFQREELKNYSKYILGIDDYVIFEDAGYSGKNTLRPAFQDMMKRIREKEFSHLLVWKIDRISRNLKDFSEMYDELKKYNITFISKNEQFDTSSAMGEAMLKIILVFAELERQLTAERVSSIMLSRAEKGLWNGAPVPLGYVWDPVKKFPVPDKEQSETVRLIFDKYENDRSTGKVTVFLNTNGVSTKRGGTWTSKTVVNIIRNPFYKGTYRYNYRESARGKKKDPSEWILVDNNHEPIISVDQWERCNKIMDKNASKNTAMFRSNGHIHIFSGLVECNQCGKLFRASLDRARKDGFRPSIYRCIGAISGLGCSVKMVGEVSFAPIVVNYISNLLKAQKTITKNHTLSDLEKILLTGKHLAKIKNINKSDLEALYTSIVTDSSEPEYMALPNKKNKMRTPKEIKLAKLEREKKKSETALERLMNLYLYSDTPLTEKELIIKRKSLESEIEKINDEIKVLYKDAADHYSADDKIFFKQASYFMLNNKLFKRNAINYKWLCQTIDPILLKDFINTLIKKVIVDNGTVVGIQLRNGLTQHFIYKNG
ncbi:MAG: recombinase family protein [Flavobacteriales bacterium]|nr:recombinase family protein [Flavobacteriales bacterium]